MHSQRRRKILKLQIFLAICYLINTSLNFLIHGDTFGNEKQVHSIVLASEKVETKLEGKKKCH